MAKEKIGALVPVEEQPYPVPENWRWVYLTDGYAECKDSFRKPVNSTERAGRVGDIPYYGATGQVGWIDDFLTDEELVLLGEDGAPFLDLYKDKAYIIDGKAWVNNHAHILKSYYGHAGNIYLMHYLNIFNFTGYVNGTTRMKLTQASMDTIPIPLSPLTEQQRIVDRIESLFAKLDEAKEKAQAVVDGFEDRKAAILHQAFTGKLSRQFDTSWKEVKLKELVSDFKYGSSEKSNYTNNGMPVLRIPNIGDEGIVFSDMKYLAHNNVDADSQIHENDILIIRSNGSRDLVGKCAVVPSLDRAYAYASFLIRIKPSDMVNPIYLSMYLNSSDARSQMFAKAKSSAGINNINTKELGEIVLRLPCLSEQKRIVSFLTAQLNRVISCKKAAEKAVDLIEHLKKAILARAFRGELGTNDPSEPPADIGVS